jgi:hypothetical protein
MTSRAVSSITLRAALERFTVATLPPAQAKAAKTKLDAVEAAAPAPYLQFVDGRLGAPLESVKPGGTIRFKFSRLDIVLEWIYEMLVEQSPVGPNDPPHLHYIEDHELYYDGLRQENLRLGELPLVPPGTVAMIVNGRPYAARIERGLSVQAPSGVYEITALAAQRRFPGVKIVFDMVSLAAIAATVRSRSLTLGPRAHLADYRYPAIIVRE